MGLTESILSPLSLRTRPGAPRRVPAALLPLLAVVATACGGDSSTEPHFDPIDLSGAWVTATPAEVGLDATSLDAALDYGGTVAGLNGVVVVKDGRLVAERYYDPEVEDVPQDGRSVTKSVTGTLVGLAADMGMLSLDQTLEDWFPDYELSPEQKAITIRDMLTMRSGITWTDDVDYPAWLQSGHQVRYVLDKAIVADPDEQFIYNSGTAHLLSIILSRATDSNAALMAQEYIFDPLGIAWEDWIWRTWPDGTPNGASDLVMTLTDWAKLGQLYLQGGRSGEQQVLPASWVEAATDRQVSLGNIGLVANAGYGYLWWRDDDAPRGPAWFAYGYGGQFIYILPKENLVVATTAVWHNVGSTHNQHEFNIMRFIRDHVLSAVE